MPIKNILIIEYLSSGALVPDGQIPGSLLAEGFAMLASVCADFTTLLAPKGRKAVHTLLDHRLKPYGSILEGHVYKYLKRKTLEETLEKIIAKYDATLIIAPDGPPLLNLLEIAEDAGVIIVGPSTAEIEKVSPKSLLYERCNQLDILSPPEYRVLTDTENFSTFRRELAFLHKKWHSPIVIKPDMGCGGQGLSIVLEKNKKNLKIAYEKAKVYDEAIILQKMVRGSSISLNLIGTTDLPKLLSINKQFLCLSSPDGNTEYIGGLTPIEYEKVPAIIEDIRKLTADTGYRGYFGIDLVVNNKGYSIVDLNPRITTSYTGLRGVSLVNPAQIMRDVALGNSPPTPRIEGSVRFGKVPFHSSTLELSLEIFEMPGCLSPPFHFTDKPHAFFTAKGDDSEESEKKFSKYIQDTKGLIVSS
ncbi:MAG: ATP-grasp domain-containing protein [Candidatus Bathyarchaeota archaeon]|nr:ATP-grasp domain-containing protein [Candidatus Bathyarchaeota archaeon]